MKDRPTSADVAKLAGVSRATVSYILRGIRVESFPDETRSRVLEAARTLGYRVNIVAQNLRSRSTKTVGLVSFRLDSAVSAGILAGAERVLTPLGYNLIVTCSHYDPSAEADQVAMLLQHQVAGIIALPYEPIDHRESSYWAAACAAVPVCMNTCDTLAGWNADYIAGDDRRALYTATKHLIEHGHTRIAHIRGVAQASGNIERQRGYEEAMTEAGLELSPELIVGDSFEGAGVADAVDGLLRLTDRPTAFACGNDFIAAEAVLALREKGLAVPEDVAVTGLADVDPARYLGITTMRHDFEQIGASAAELLLSRMTAPQIASRVLVQRASLLLRRTCGCDAAADRAACSRAGPPLSIRARYRGL